MTARVPTADDAAVAAMLRRTTFPPDGSVTCAVSGGADSTALLALAIASGRDVLAVHVDHGLRPGSSAEAEQVAATASAWGASFRPVTARVGEGGDLEARARAARRSVLPPGTLFGHTADDQAETVLLRLLRGTGPAGLAAMDAALHPLLELRRSETRGLCEHLGVEVVEDPSNQDTRFRRNRVRHEVLPLLDDVADRDVVPLLCRLADQAAEQSRHLEALADAVDPTDRAAVMSVARPVAVAALRRWWHERTGAEHPPDHAAMMRMLQVVSGDAPSCDVNGGWRVLRTRGRLRLEHPGDTP